MVAFLHILTDNYFVIAMKSLFSKNLANSISVAANCLNEPSKEHAFLKFSITAVASLVLAPITAFK